ncbi:MAG: Nitrate/sulfonate/bicarbonate transporter permease, permease protein [Frankiales bacterium]|nr:Nitrate/sulfonate/bicarbonate transporter permease, permease protein [Frankiales bacterium]
MPADLLVRPAATAPPAPAHAWRVLWLTGRLLRATVAIALFLALWEIAPRVGLADRTFLPPFSEVAQAWWGLVQDGSLRDNTEASLKRALGGFVLAVLIAVPLGLALGWYRPLAEVLNPLLEVFRNTAALALLPVFVLVLGIGETSKIAIVTYSCVWPVLLNTMAGVQGVDPLLVRSARSMGLSAPQLFRKVVLPGAVPTIFTGVRLAGAFSILVLLAAELVGAKAGLGYLITASQSSFQIPDMYAAIVTISLLGLVLNQALLLLERRATRWRVDARS